MDGLIRSLKYAAFRAGRVIGITLLMSVAFVFYFLFLNGERFTVEAVASQFPFMLIIVGNLMFMLYGMVDVATYTQYTLSYGCTRKNMLISTILMHLLQIAAVEAVMLAYFALVPKGWEVAGRSELCGYALLLFLFGSGLALVMGVLIRRFGKLTYVIFAIFAGGAGGVMGMLVGFSGGSIWLYELLPALRGLPMLACAGGVWYAAMAVVFWLCARRMEVRV